MSETPQPLYLQPRRYRRRRLVDAAKFVPLIGLALFLIPLIWSSEGEDVTGLSRAVVYIFVVWAGLIGITALVSRQLARHETESSTGPTDGEKEQG